jgi:hypothetical protein
MIEKQIQEFEEKQKSYAKAYMILCLVVIIIFGTYSSLKIREYITLKAGTEANTKLISLLQAEASTERASYEINRKKTDEIIEEIEKKLETIFPVNDDYTQLTRQIDKIEDQLNRTNDPFEISSLDYMNVLKEGKYSILPIRMNIKSSGENFTKFLHLVENSGSLNDGLRLMDVSSIRLSFQDARSPEETNMINFSVLINAYFQGGK